MSIPMLEYLTVFRSRVGLANVVLPLVGFAAARRETLLRKLRGALDQRVKIDVADPANQHVLAYLIDKQLIGSRPRRGGRYGKFLLVHKDTNWTANTSKGEPIKHLPVFIADIWFSDSRLSSTIGVPTPDNSEEIFDFCASIGIVSKARVARTSEGHLVSVLRELSGPEVNPFALGLESAAVLRQVITHDALILYALTQELAKYNESFRRDDLIPTGFIAIATRAVDAVRDFGMPPQAVVQTKGFLRLIEDTIKKKSVRAAAGQKAARGAKSGSRSEGPGVLEHRLSPRLEWLTDFGILLKDGPKNVFSYRQTPAVKDLSEGLGQYLKRERTADDVALNLSTRDARWQALRADRRANSLEEALIAGYRSIQMSIGPVPIREVCFIAALHLDPIPQVADLRRHLLRWSEREQGIRLAGGRYRREPEMVHFSEEVIR
jgi:hypothetical protein